MVFCSKVEKKQGLESTHSDSVTPSNSIASTKKGENMAKALYTETGRIVASVESGTMTAVRRESLHKLKGPPAWAFDKTVVEQAVDAKARRIVVTCIDTGKSYRVAMDDFNDNAVELRRGHGTQMMLPMKYWSTEAELQLAMELT